MFHLRPLKILSKVVALLGGVLLLVFGFIAGTTAQNETLLVALTGIESQNFPQVVAFLTVSDANGPVEGLTVDNFNIFEDDLNSTAITPLTVEHNSLEELRLVLALDVSMSQSDLAKAKTAALDLVNTLGAKDKVALLSFGDDVTVEHDFTNNTTELSAAIDQLTAQGNQTALYQAVAQAAYMLDPVPTGRKAIIVITDSRDNAGIMSLDDMIVRIQKARLPVYILGFGDKVQGAHPLKTEVPLTGGQYLTLTGIDQLQSNLLQLMEQLRQGYRIVFLSGLMADNTEHDFYIVVTKSMNGTEIKGEAGDQFITTPGQVKISLRDLVPGQTVMGMVRLAADVSAPDPSVLVSYWLDNQLLAEVTTPPYNFTWDSATAGAGNHTLTVKAIDRVGNEGQIDLDLEVILPLEVSISTPQPEIEVGQTVTMSVRIETSTEIEKIEFLVNDQVLETKTVPPYDVSFSSHQYSPGTYQATVRVTDKVGYVAEDSLELELLPEPPPPPGWLERLIQNKWVQLGFIVVVTLMAILAIILLTLVLFRMIILIQKRSSQRRSVLEIVNSGNIPSRYSLQAIDDGGNLNFNFSLKGATLPPLLPAKPVQTAPTASRTATAASSSSPAPDQEKGKGGVQQAMEKTTATQSQVSGCLSVITGILNTLGQLLPGSAGSTVARTSQKISKQQAAADRVIRTPVQQVRTAQYLQGQVAGAVPGKGGDSSTSSPDSSRLEPGLVTPASTFDSGSRSLQAKTPAQQPTNAWVETPPLEPGATMQVDFRISPQRPYQKKPYTFTLASQALDYDQTLPLNEKGLVEIKGFFWLWRYLPSVVVLLMMAWLAWQVVGLATGRLTDINF